MRQFWEDNMEDRNISYLIKQISERMCAMADAALKKQGITYSQLCVLHFLWENDGSASQKEVERHLKVSHPTVVGLVNRLEKSGFVTSKRDTKDQRNKIIELTDRASKLKDTLYRGKDDAEARLTENLSEKEKDELYWLLTLVKSSIE